MRWRPSACPPPAAADLADETALAERYAPVVRLVEQAQQCGYGESYSPLDVDVLFDEPTVALRGPWGGDLVKIAPAAEDLSPERFEYHLDFPGNALDPGCGYERGRDADGGNGAGGLCARGHRARPAREALAPVLALLRVQRLEQHARGRLGDDPARLRRGRRRRGARAAAGDVGYSQHEGAERAAWDDDKLELVGGTHPVVHPAAGPCELLRRGLHLGSSASEGVGCDDTTGPTFDVRPEVRTIPSDPAQAREHFPWIEFEGRWGELQRSIFNGPTGPNLKSQWTRPIEWSEGWRSRSLAVPGGGALGTGATDFFCGAVAAGSNALRRAVEEPQTLLLILVGLAVLLGFLLTRTSWTPAAPLRLARRRAWGQVLSATSRMYSGRLALFLGLGVLAVPISVAVTLLQALVFAPRTSSVSTEGEAGGRPAWPSWSARNRADAARARARPGGHGARSRRDRPGPPRLPWQAFRLALESVRPLLGAS